MVSIPQSVLLSQVTSLKFPRGVQAWSLLEAMQPGLPAQPPLAIGGYRHLHPRILSPESDRIS